MSATLQIIKVPEQRLDKINKLQKVFAFVWCAVPCLSQGSTKFRGQNVREIYVEQDAELGIESVGHIGKDSNGKRSR